jgi:hypothetical protein
MSATLTQPDPIDQLAGMSAEELQRELDRARERARLLQGVLNVRRRIERERSDEQAWSDPPPAG